MKLRGFGELTGKKAFVNKDKIIVDALINIGPTDTKQKLRF